MAKVTGPLYSMSASGSIGKAMVHFPWKGISVVREWLKPSNPQSADQGDVRLVLGGLGQSTRCVEATSLYREDAKLVAASGQTWVSALVKYIIANYMVDATAFEAEYTAFQAHAEKAAFIASAADLNLADFDVAYKGTAHTFSAGMQLYELAKYGIAKRNSVEGAFDRSPYDTAIANWTGTETGELEVDVTAV
jgi:hypothetical protein